VRLLSSRSQKVKQNKLPLWPGSYLTTLLIYRESPGLSPELSILRLNLLIINLEEPDNFTTFYQLGKERVSKGLALPPTREEENYANLMKYVLTIPTVRDQTYSIHF